MGVFVTYLTKQPPNTCNLKGERLILAHVLEVSILAWWICSRQQQQHSERAWVEESCSPAGWKQSKEEPGREVHTLAGQGHSTTHLFQ